MQHLQHTRFLAYLHVRFKLLGAVICLLSITKHIFCSNAFISNLNKSYPKLRSSHQFCAKYLRDLITDNHGIPDDRAHLSIFELTTIAAKLCNHLPSPICEKTFNQSCLQTEKNLRQKYRKLLETAPIKDKQLILQLQICCNSHIRSITAEIHSSE